MIQRFLTAVLVLLVLTSCATTPQATPINERVRLPDTLPVTLGEQGLLVATIAADSLAVGTLQQLAFSLAGAQIGNVYYSNAVRNNFLAIPLKPGEYTLDSLHVYRDTQGQTQDRYPLQFKFRIVSGQATNLGVIALVPEKGQANRYWKVLVDNTDDAASYLRAHNPRLAASLHPAKPVLASENKFVDANALEIVRRELARKAWLFSEDPNLTRFVGSQVGTITKLLRDSQGKLAAFDVLDSGTKAAMVSCSGHDERFVCSSAEPALYFVRGGKVDKRPLPVEAKHVWVHTFPPKGLVLVDERMNVYNSHDDGESWTKYAWHRRKEPLNPLARLKAVNGKNGYYLYAAFPVDPLVPEVIYSEYARTAYRKVDIPKMNNWQRLIETSEGLLVGPQNTDSSNDSGNLYARPNGQTEWRARPLPGPQCFFLRRENESAEKLTVICGSKIYASNDTGRTWAESAVSKK